MRTTVRYAVAGALIGAVTVEFVGTGAQRHIEIGLIPSQEHIPEPEREPLTYVSNISLAASGGPVTGTNFVTSTEASWAFVRIGFSEYWHTVRLENGPAGLLTLSGFVVVDPTSGTARPPSSG